MLGFSKEADEEGERQGMGRFTPHCFLNYPVMGGGGEFRLWSLGSWIAFEAEVSMGFV